MTDWLSVPTWPRWARRSFVLTLPLSVPVYVVCAAGFLMCLMVAIVVMAPIAGVAAMWEGDQERRALERFRREHDENRQRQ